MIVFVDTPIDAALKRVDKRAAQAIPEQHKAWERSTADLIAEYRERGNILEVRLAIANGLMPQITGQWPADEVLEQVEAKLESALELEERGEL